MADKEHLDLLLKGGVKKWNAWRLEQQKLRRSRRITPDLVGADLALRSLRYADLNGANLYECNASSADLRESRFELSLLESANLSRANLRKTDFFRADMTNANLREADLRESILTEANLSGADLSRARLHRADLRRADLTGANLWRTQLVAADLTGACLNLANLVSASLKDATLVGCRVYGTSAWNVYLKGTKQSELVITTSKQPTVTVDNLEVAQLIYLLLENKNIRNIIESVSSKMVLILGRFSPERKLVLDAIRDSLRRRNYSPVIFDFDQPMTRDISETVVTLAHLSKFIIADLTDARSIPQELSMIVPNLPSVPVQPLLEQGASEYGMFEHFKRYPWVSAVIRYSDVDDLVRRLRNQIVLPMESRVKKLRPRT
jgi:hypothetical protein